MGVYDCGLRHYMVSTALSEHLRDCGGYHLWSKEAGQRTGSLGPGRKLCQVGGRSAPAKPGGLYVSFCEHLRESDIFGLQS